MTDAALTPTAASGPTDHSQRRSAIGARLKKRHAAERRFKLYGRLAIFVALAFLVVLLGRIVAQGAPTLVAYDIALPVYIDPAKVEVSDPGGANYDQLIAQSLLKTLGETDDDLGETSSAAQSLLSTELGFHLLDQIKADPSLIGKTVTVKGPIKADASLYLKGEIKRATAQEDRKVTDRQMAWLDRLKSKGLIKGGFNSRFFTASDSTEPEQAGVLGAVVGSALMLVVTALLAVPAGVLAAVYLEEFAPKNRWTEIIEVNINNLAAVPSIVYGLLGLALFINWLGVPRSSPLVGGLVLALMALPTVIIATRQSLKSVPPSIREAAMGVGASRAQTVFHHVLPLAVPGIMTGVILSLAHAMGETAPLLMVGMVAFNPGVPAGVTDASTVLPVQVFIWENASERAFHERTAAAILVLVGFMVLMNLIAVIVRRRFERRW
jgi:phosphate transport system permease protein